MCIFAAILAIFKCILLQFFSSVEEPAGGDPEWLSNSSYNPPPSAAVPPPGQRSEIAARDANVTSTSSEKRHHHKTTSTGTKRNKDDESKHKSDKIFVRSTDDLESIGGYRIDSRADTDNLYYDGLYSGDVAVYRRRFEVVGLGCGQWVELNDGRSKAREKAKKEKQFRYFKGANLGERELVRPLVESDASDVEYLSFDVKPNAEAAESVTLETRLSKLTSEYNSSLLKDPHNVQLWLEFIALQDQLDGWRQVDDEKVGKVMRAILERKVAIFERALESNPTSVELLTGYMELVRELWETEKIVRKWKDIVFHQPNKTQLWLGYINFCQTSFSSFTVSSQLSLYRKCITTLVSILSGSLQSHCPEQDTQDQLLNIFFLYCQFLEQTGHSEKAVACYQALIEFNLCCPQELLHEPSRIKLEFFETFWDSGCPRFGEQGALGWHNWTKATQTNSTHFDKLGLVDISILLETAESTNVKVENEGVDPELAVILGQSLPEAWVTLEVNRTLEQCLPWRPDESKGESEDDCTDPDRLVLFDDVSPTLVELSDPVDQLKLVLGFIQLLGAPVALASPLEATAVKSVSQISADILDTLSCLSDQSVKILHTLGFRSHSVNSLSDFGQGLVHRLLSAAPTSSALCTPAIHNAIVLSINQALSLFADVAAQTNLARVLLTFLLCDLRVRLLAEAKPSKQTKLRIKAVQKLTKNILRLEKHRNNLTLWNCCALTEHLLGNFADANKLHQSLLSQHPTPVPQLVTSYCECLVGLQATVTGLHPPDQAQQLNMAVHAIVCLSEGKWSPLESSTMSAARILRARSKFERNSSSCQDISVSEMLCHCYLDYFTRGLEATCNVFDQYTASRSQELDQLAKHSPKFITVLETVERLFTKQVKLVERHCQLYPNTPPKLMRTVLEKALAVFPDNSLFLARFICGEQRSFISGRLRRFFDTNTSARSYFILWLYSVAAELQRYCHLLRAQNCSEETSVGTVNRLRAVLNRATESASGRQCPLLWRIYMTVLVRPDMTILICMIEFGYCTGSQWQE